MCARVCVCPCVCVQGSIFLVSSFIFGVLLSHRKKSREQKEGGNVHEAGLDSSYTCATHERFSQRVLALESATCRQTFGVLLQESGAEASAMSRLASLIAV